MGIRLAVSNARERQFRWVSTLLRFAAAYHVIVFSAIWLIPGHLPALSSDAPSGSAAADFWRAHAIGTSFGLGVGLFLASFSPVRQWAVVGASAAICAMTVAFSAIGAVSGSGPVLPWWHVVCGYALWLPPLGLMLREAWEEFLGQQRIACPEIQRMAMRTRTSVGVSLDELSRLSPVMVIFLRHLGCPFCREALADLARDRAEIESDGTRIVLVHLSSEREILDRLAPGLADVVRLPDPNQVVYRAFGLGRGRLPDVFGPLVWFRFLQVAFFRRRGFGFQDDIFQMPGVFMVYHGQVIRSFRHQSIADRPNYRALASASSQPEFQGS